MEKQVQILKYIGTAGIVFLILVLVSDDYIWSLFIDQKTILNFSIALDVVHAVTILLVVILYFLALIHIGKILRVSLAKRFVRGILAIAGTMFLLPLDYAFLDGASNTSFPEMFWMVIIIMVALVALWLLIYGTISIGKIYKILIVQTQSIGYKVSYYFFKVAVILFLATIALWCIIGIFFNSYAFVIALSFIGAAICNFCSQMAFMIGTAKFRQY